MQYRKPAMTKLPPETDGRIIEVLRKSYCLKSKVYEEIMIFLELDSIYSRLAMFIK